MVRLFYKLKNGRGDLGPPTKVAISLLLQELRHFNPTGGYDVNRLYHSGLSA